jgi:DNA-binding transcriptional LysR family regulator
MRIQSLKMFCDLADTGSFTKTARLNHVSQSAVSQQITAMERHFKCLLVERSKRAFRLTREGDVLYDYSQRVLADYRALRSQLPGRSPTQFRSSVAGRPKQHLAPQPTAVLQARA